ncbi:MAG: preprotein translocase subunit SecA [Waltera sp.]|uniref:Protein translocase subunit SecA n=3 Tax=Waltera TaxID=2815781 RepID=A0A6L5YL66_9FIRM|nr:preprotein translocase subunit SecA [Waltera intestinalis]MBP7198707.1 preprotein translocase subunit SecA [Acetatifactor sp.]MBS6825879.1 preprotein translocase subunit SecA [Bacillota bacterium]MCI6516024.1 preprotein translocase subunit SecA [Lachnospiraceae bacterium]OLA53698.1 MAG: preprotein translocase subunit SecA [Firmicutes bacterium CAG:65_45_313]RHQ74621.1 preprotein translocase subunit SecA [Firmicutes bacterium AF22-6AC]CDA99757.1 protein translocase subunit SecA [Firmicutes 
MSVIEKIFGTHSSRELKRIEPLVDKIEALRPTMQALSDEELRGKTEEYKKRLTEGETLDDLLPEAYATVREAAKRVLNMEHYRVQLIGGIILHQGRIAEMRTGEGKTLVSTLPAYLNALEGKGVHVVTVNDYLAKRDAEWMGQVHEFLGLKVGVVLNSMTSEERQEAYKCDITYVTNNELGFDYLRDNMVIYKEQLVLRGLHYAIIDEVDSVLIDEARTPLIISGQSGKSTALYEMCDLLARQMKRGDDVQELTKMDAIMGVVQEETGDFVVNEKDKIINLTAAGMEKVERFFHIDNFADPENLEIQHNIILALRAHNLMFRDKDYVVKDDQVLIVDEFTGRIMPGRRYSDGLHQAIEAKEHVKVKRESKTLASITFQNFFNLFDKKCGMTGTALTEETEFREIYGMDVVVIPTNRPVIRKDLQDAVYKTKREKLNAIVNAVEEAHATGQPVLVGTITIEASEELSRMLTKRGIQHKVLNAKFHELEAEIVADAGVHGAVTIATNMAGRGTDIKLDDEARAAGGLKIIGTERHESRRIDNQLRGRSGRQGDPGESKFYISLEDDLMRLFGSERLISMFNTLGIPEGQEIEHKALTNAIESAQKKIESNNYGIRKNLLEYDRVMSEQREIIYEERLRVLNGESMRDVIYKMITDITENCVDICINDDADISDWDFNELNTLLIPTIPLQPLTPERVKKPKKNSLKQQLKEEAVKLYEAKEAEFPEPEAIRELERVVLLKVIDRKWMDHIDDMEQLRQGVGLQAYGQRDPLVEYKMSGYEMFDEMTQNIREETVRLLFHIKIEQKVEREQQAKITGTNKDDSLPKGPVKRENAKVYPNDPCPCGSGKKYKNCCGRKA